MAEQSALVTFRTIINGVDVQGQTEEYTAPEIKLKEADVKGGRFLATDIVTGMEKLSAKVVLSGVRRTVLNTLKVTTNNSTDIKVLASYNSESGGAYGTEDVFTGRVRSVASKPVKGEEKPETTIEFSVSRYKLSEDGTVIHDIDQATQKMVIFGTDIMAPHLKNTGRG